MKTLDLTALKPFYDEPVEARNAGAGLLTDRKLTATYHRRRFIDAQKATSAAATLGSLPERGDTYHIIASGNWPAWALVPLRCSISQPQPRFNRFILRHWAFPAPMARN